MRILILDIETRPALVYTWGMFNQSFGPSQVVDWGGVLCFAAKWHGDDKDMFYAEWKGRDRMIRAAHRLLSEADAVVGWNSQRFDTRWLHAEFQRAGMARPSPYVNVDLMRSQKRDAFMLSNKLESRRLWLGEEGKAETGGFGLWKRVMDGDREAKRLLEEYNRRDVEITEEEFNRMRAGGWVRGLPNHAIEGGHVCPSCGSGKLQARGWQVTLTRRYKRFQCRECGSWSRAVHCEPGAAQIKAIA
jgi:hypothetical protein